jgi:serine/threonine-protein kinase
VLLAAKDSEHADFTKLVVIKRLREEYAQDLDFVTMFVDEARLAARLNHPNVIQTLDVGQDGDDLFLAMEYLDGQPLKRILARAPEIPLVSRLTILSEALSGLHYAHELKDFDGSPLDIVHRDVTPHNLFVTYEGQVKVMDFGIAKAVGRAAATRHGVIKGKVNYMAPEQVVATRSLDRRADIFAIGVMLFEACVNGRMWAGQPAALVLRALVQGSHPRSPRERLPDVPEPLDQICRRALAPDAADRYPTAEALQEELDAYLSTIPQRPGTRKIGAFVAAHFAEQRAKALAVIESQLAEVHDTKRTLTSVLMDESESSASEAGELDATTQSPGLSHRYAQHVTETPPPAAPPRKARSITMLVGTMVVATVLGLAAIVRVVAAPSAGPASMTLTLRATPLETTFQVDDGPPLDNPSIDTLPRDGQSHKVRASAPGFESKAEDVRFDHDVSIRFSLVRKGK